MPRVRYRDQNFKDATLEIIHRANSIIDAYSKAGLRLTLRQLYYQFVRRDWFPESWADPKTGSTNNERSYKRLGNMVNDGRLAGMIDWHAIEDRTRNLRSRPHWETPADIIEAAAQSFALDKWVGQNRRVEVWIEKDALLGVIEEVCGDLDVAFFSCRGYTSQSEMWDAAQRLIRYSRNDQHPLILHLGDHDPSGIDMTRDIRDRLELFMEHHGVESAEVKRIALNWDQVQQYNPPPNPAKITDSRATKYIERFGVSSWELDALEPTVLIDLIRSSVESVMDRTKWDGRVKKQEHHRELLSEASSKWPEVATFLEGENESDES